MANLKDIKRRIGSVESTKKITNAMKLVSAAKFARANHAVENSRPYAEAFTKMMSDLMGVSKQRISSPLLEKRGRKRPEKKVLLAIVSTDRGLCGALNSNLLKAAHSFIQEREKEGMEVAVAAYGRRAISFAKKEGFQIEAKKEKVLEKPSHELAIEISEQLKGYYLDGSFNSVHVVYARFRSALDQSPEFKQLLPIDLSSMEEEQEYASSTVDTIVEPVLESFVDELLERHVVGSVFDVLLNGSASEHGARMTAMDSATNNAKELIRKLTLEYNRARQAAITTELTEIISGAQAIS